MARLIMALFGGEQGRLRRKIGGLYLLLAAFNLGVWAWAVAAFHHYPLLMSTSLLAYSLGLRHAADADHIAAIDNVTRKLMRGGKPPLTVGLMFSLGHSTIVILASAGIAATATTLHTRFAGFREIGGVIGVLVPTLFLFALALINLVTLRSAIRALRRVRRGEPHADENVDEQPEGRGFLARLFLPLFHLITKSSHMYILGVLFGLGFDTATEIGLLGISAASSTHGMAIWLILVFPALFTAGMALVDTTDNILMYGVYGWALNNPLHKLHYNIAITLISVVIALAVSSIQGLRLLVGKLRFGGGFWDLIGHLNDNFATIGYLIISVFLVSWLLSAVRYWWKALRQPKVTSRQI